MNAKANADFVSCKCLNVQFCLKSLAGEEHVSDGKNLETEPFSDDFGIETELDDAATITSLLVSPRLVKTALTQPNNGASIKFMYLVGSKRVGQWNIFRCLNCNTLTHAVSIGKADVVVVNFGEMLAQSEQDTVIKNNPHYCKPLGIVCSPTSTYHSENTKGSLKPSVMDFIRSVQDNVGDFLEEEQLSMRNRVQEYEREQVALYHDVEAKTQKNLKNLERQIWTIFGDTCIEEEDSAFERSLEAISFENSNVSTVKKERSSSAVDDMFDLDPLAADDDDDAANDDIFDSDEDIPNYRTRGSNSGAMDNLAKSVPIPIMRRMMGSTSGLIVSPDSPRERTPDPENMEASINALARSVGFDGTEIFGDLPRPRFNTGTRNPTARHY